MKNRYFSQAFVVLSYALCSGCFTNDVAPDERKPFQKPIDPVSEPGRLSRMLIIAGTNRDGDLPESNSSIDAVLTYVQESASVTADNSVFVPFVFESASEIRKMYLTVAGADNFWDIPVNAGSGKSFVIDVGIPNNVMSGDFDFEYKLENSAGVIGDPRDMDVEIVPVEAACGSGSFSSVSGSDGLAVRSYRFGNTAGTISVLYQTYSVPDRVDIRYGETWYAVTGSPLNGSTPPIKRCSEVTGDDGFQGTNGRLDIPYDPSNSQRLDVYVSGCLDGGTAWDFQVLCPESDKPEEEEQWYSDLPDCPCTLADLRNVLGGTQDPVGIWELENSASQTFHYGARYEARWVPGDEAGLAGQQCTYDTEGDLITAGIAAGSPDRFSPGTHDDPSYWVGAHAATDVSPWYVISCESYLAGWPSNAEQCPARNEVSGISHMKKLVSNMSCPAITTLLKEASESTSIPSELRDYLFGRSATVPEEEKIVEWLGKWKDDGCVLGFPLPLCDLIDRAIWNMKRK